MAEKTIRERLREGLEVADKKIQDTATKVKDNVKAGIDVTGAVVKTVGKRVIGDDSKTDLKPETKKTLGIE